LPDCETHSPASKASWISIAPVTVFVTGGRSRSGMFSLKPHAGGTSAPALSSDGTREASENPTSARNAGLKRAISMIAPPGTFATPARMESSRARSFTP